MTDDRISRYLHDQAGAIELRPATPASVAHRARRRRRVRRTTVMAAAVVTLGTSTLVVTRGGDDPEELTAQSAAVTPSALDWSVVDTTSGLSADAYGGPVVSADGAVYSLSTAPGPFDPDVGSVPATLYRSTDGAEWSPVGMPDDFSPTALAGQGSRLYTVGTAPAGGAVTYRLASSDDGGSTWSTTDVPSDLRALAEQYPDEIVVSPPTVAVHEGTVVVSGTVTANPDIEDRLPESDRGMVWSITDDGVEVSPPECGSPDEGIPGTPTPPPPTPPASPPEDGPTTTTVPASPPVDIASQPAEPAPPLADGSSPTTVTVPPGGIGADPTASMVCEPVDDHDVRTYTWADLGVDDELRDLARSGRTYVYVSHDGGAFAPADTGGQVASQAHVVAADDGFTLLLGLYADGEFTTDVMRSADGTVWEPAGEITGEVVEVGTVAGRAAAAVRASNDYVMTVRLAQADGSWLTVDPRAALDEPVGAEVRRVAFGPLGWAATLWGADGTSKAVHSADGPSMSVVPLDDLLDLSPDVPVALEPLVTADAVLVMVTDPAADDDDPATVPPQWVVVGTPPG